MSGSSSQTTSAGGEGVDAMNLLFDNLAEDVKGSLLLFGKQFSDSLELEEASTMKFTKLIEGSIAKKTTMHLEKEEFRQRLDALTKALKL